jgi:hypothetical protein
MWCKIASIHMQQNRYSRLRRTENKNNTRTAVVYTGLTIAAIVLIIFFGIPAMGKVAGFLLDLSSSNQPVDINDTTPPAPPTIDRLPEYTNKTSVEITGRTEEGAIVTLFVNDLEEEIVANAQGAFSYNWSLWKGDNKVRAKARDAAGNESQETQTYKIVYDNKAPELTIKSPADGTTFSGSRERQITIEGTTEARAAVTINGRIVAVDENGDFSFFTALSEGENNFEVSSKDLAGNETKSALTLHFNP